MQPWWFDIVFNPFVWLFFAAIVYPFWYIFIGRDRIARRRQAAADAASQSQHSKLQEEVQPERFKQLRDLKDSLPKDPPQRMRAVFAVNKIQVPKSTLQRRIKHLRGEDTFMTDYHLVTLYAADMILQLTETERAIIKQHALDDVVLEDNAAYTPDELLRLRVEAQERSSAITDPLVRELTKSGNASVAQMLAQERTKTRVGDLLVSPFSRNFDTPHQANEYLNILKTKHLPKLRELIDSYSAHKPTEMIEF